MEQYKHILENPVLEEIKIISILENTTTENPVIENPVLKEVKIISILENPIIENPVIENPVIENPVLEEVKIISILENPVIENPVIENPIIENPIIENPIIENPIIENPVIENPVLEVKIISILENPVIENPVIENPIIENPIIENPVIEIPVIENPVIQNPVLENPILENLVENSIIEEVKIETSPKLILELVEEENIKISKEKYIEDENSSSIISSITSSNINDRNSFDNMFISDLSSSNSNSNISMDSNKFEYVIEYVNTLYRYNMDKNMLDINNTNMLDINKTNILANNEEITFNNVLKETNLDKISITSSNENIYNNQQENIENNMTLSQNVDTLTNQLENVIYKNNLINQSNTAIPELIENHNLDKHKVSFSQIDINEIKPLNETINMNNLYGNNSITNSSDFSYTRAIKSKSLPNIEPLFNNKNIRLRKPKNKKKIIELDEVDYLYNKLQDYQRNMIINRCNYIILIAKAMEIIEDYTDLQNNNKKDTVIKALNRLVMIDLDLNEFDQRFFLSSMSNIIELIIACTINKYNNNDKKNYNNKNDMSDDISKANCGQVIYSIIDKLTTIVLKKQYNSDKLFTNMATITDILMILVDKYNYLSGAEKKMIVLQAINKFICNKLEYIIELSPEKKKDLINALESIPLTIDLFIALQKGKYKINKRQSIVVKKHSWIKSLCGCSNKYIEE
jgi:hypothetical protein